MIEYALNKEMTEAIIAMVNNEAYEEFAPIREQELRFQIASMVKTNTEGEQLPTSGEPVVVRRVGPADAVFMQGHYKIYICQKRWDEANELQQKAMLHRALMRINIEKKEEGIKLSLRKPDVATFQQTIVRFGAWEENLILLRSNLQTAQKRAKELAAEATNKP